jgi:hypothetical protein
MRRKCLAVGLILLLIGTSVIPITAQDIKKSILQTSSAFTQKTIMSHSVVPRGGFGLQSVIHISRGNETQKPLVPGGEPRIINLTVTYGTVLRTPFSGKIVLLYCILRHQYMTVNLEVGDTPSWCTASLSNSQLQFPITDTMSSQTTILAVAVNEYAPAYQLFGVYINASVDTLRGPFDLLPFVSGYWLTSIMNFVPGYFPRIIVTPASDYINATPGNTSHLPINITNRGNDRTVVYIDIVDFPSGHWLISIPSQVVLDVNMNSEIILSIVPPNNFHGTDTITMTFTPCKADDYTQHGEPVNITIVVVCEP